MKIGEQEVGSTPGFLEEAIGRAAALEVGDRLVGGMRRTYPKTSLGGFGAGVRLVLHCISKDAWHRAN